MSAPQTIWLQPLCCAEHDEFGRLWCENDDFDCEDGVSGDEYTRTDTIAAALIEAERRGMMRAAEIVLRWQSLLVQGQRIDWHVDSVLAAIRHASGELK